VLAALLIAWYVLLPNETLMSDNPATPTAPVPQPGVEVPAHPVDGSGLRRAAMARAHSSSIRRSGVYRQKFIHYCIILTVSTTIFIAVAYTGFNNDYVIYPAIATFALVFLVSTAWFARSIFKFMGQYADRLVARVK
jgi:hypothetical protein